MPMHLRKKMRKQNKPKPLHFEMMPTQGYLAPGQRMNVQIKFMPTESVNKLYLIMFIYSTVRGVKCTLFTFFFNEFGFP